MAYIIAEPCINVKDKACVEVCPVDCIYEGEHDARTSTPRSASTAAPASRCARSRRSSPRTRLLRTGRHIELNKQFFGTTRESSPPPVPERDPGRARHPRGPEHGSPQLVQVPARVECPGRAAVRPPYCTGAVHFAARRVAISREFPTPKAVARAFATFACMPPRSSALRPPLPPAPPAWHLASTGR